MHTPLSARADDSVLVIPRDRRYDKAADEQKRVAPYCRVSTLQESQEDSYEMQQQYYRELIESHPNWEMVDMYADHGISATSMKRREDFLRMIEDCKAGKIDMIIAKTVSRFARNIVDCVATCRMLKNLDPPVAVYFEAQNLNTLGENSEIMLSLLATLAQSESETKSTSVKWGIRKRFAIGVPKIMQTYGFDLKDGTLVANKDMETVKLIYGWAADGVSLSEIRERLRIMKVPSPKGRPEWPITTIRYILSNEKYAGDILMQKTYVFDLMEHRSRKNTGQEPQYKLEGKLEATIPKEQWLKVQRLLGNSPAEAILVPGLCSDVGPWKGLRTVLRP